LQEAAAYADAGSSRLRPSRMTAAEAGGHSRRGWGCWRQESAAYADDGSSRPRPVRMTAAEAGIRSQRRMGMPRADAGCGPRVPLGEVRMAAVALALRRSLLA